MNGFWWLFFYALSSGILVTTLLPLNITIIKEFNLQKILVALFLRFVIWNPRNYFITFEHYHY